MKKLMITAGFAAMLSMFTAFAANANGYNRNENRMPASSHQNERVDNSRGRMGQRDDHARDERGRDEHGRDEHGRNEQRFDRGHMDHMRGHERMERDNYHRDYRHFR